MENEFDKITERLNQIRAESEERRKKAMKRINQFTIACTIFTIGLLAWNYYDILGRGRIWICITLTVNSMVLGMHISSLLNNYLDKKLREKYKI